MTVSETQKSKTQSLFNDCFIQLVEDSSLSHTHIVDLIKTLGINRNTFYYYYSGKYDVAVCIFLRDLADLLLATVPSECLVNLPISDSPHSTQGLPYWTHIETGAHELDMSAFVKALGRTMRTKPRFYRMLFNPSEREFYQALESIWRGAISQDLHFILGGRYMPEETKRLLVSLQAQAVNSLCWYFAYHEDDVEALCDDRINPFSNIMQEAVSRAVQEHPVNRILRRATR